MRIPINQTAKILFVLFVCGALGCTSPTNEHRQRDESVWYQRGVEAPTASFEIRLVVEQASQKHEVRNGRDGVSLLVDEAVALSNEDILRARVVASSIRTQAEPNIELELTESGSKKLAEFSEKNIGRKAALLIDGVVQANPVINAVIQSKTMEISGVGSQAEAQSLAKGLVGSR